MAEQSSERSEQPTGRKLDKAREEGKVARSPELPASAVMIITVLVLLVSGAGLVSGLVKVFSGGLRFDKSTLHTPAQLPLVAADQLLAAFALILPILLITAAMAVLSSGATGGFFFSIKAVQPKLSKISLLAGLSRVFGTRALIELGKTLLKFLIVGSTLLFVVNAQLPVLMRVGHMPMEAALQATAKVVGECALWVTLSMVLIALLDVPLQRFQFIKGMRMTKQEVRDEMKEAEGRPEVRAQIRRRQREMANARMMKRVKDADVVITNPDHFAVALHYEPASDNPPLLVAKGVDHTAQRIREEAALHGIPTFEAPPLARALYFTTELEQPVPPELYFAVAQVIGYVFSLNDVRPGAAPLIKPVPEVPPSMLFNTRGERLAEQGVAA